MLVETYVCGGFVFWHIEDPDGHRSWASVSYMPITGRVYIKRPGVTYWACVSSLDDALKELLRSSEISYELLNELCPRPSRGVKNGHNHVGSP